MLICIALENKTHQDGNHDLALSLVHFPTPRAQATTDPDPVPIHDLIPPFDGLRSYQFEGHLRGVLGTITEVNDIGSPGTRLSAENTEAVITSCSVGLTRRRGEAKGMIAIEGLG